MARAVSVFHWFCEMAQAQFHSPPSVLTGGRLPGGASLQVPSFQSYCGQLVGTSGSQILWLSSLYQSAYSFFNIMLEHLFRFVAGCWLNNQLLRFFFPCPVEQSQGASPLTAGYLKEKTLMVSTWLAVVILPFCPTMSHQALLPECAGPLHILPLYSKSKSREEN